MRFKGINAASSNDNKTLTKIYPYINTIQMQIYAENTLELIENKNKSLDNL